MNKPDAYVQMVGLLPAPIPESNLLIWFFIAVIIAIGIALILKRLKPHNHLARQLKNKAINARECLHLLARTKNIEASKQQIDSLRFAKKEPSREDVLQLIKTIQHAN